ncbi:MAG TPA: CPBP family glutamic-type intramembrane protease [Eoetvoesiella sp.]
MANAAEVSFRFRDEVRDFVRFVRHPRVTPRLPGRAAASGWWQDWFPALSVGRLLKWAFLLWAVNLVFLGPIAVLAAGAGGAHHRLDIQNIPWLQALLWAPIVEELVFRYGLRHAGLALWLVPAMVVALVAGPNWATVALVGAALLLCWKPYLKKNGGTPKALAWRHRVLYLRWFPWVFHAAALLFAAVHLNNFSLNQMPYWLMPLLVLPQWLTGLVLGWLRVKRGIGASMLLHGIFNSGPLLVVWLVLNALPNQL